MQNGKEMDKGVASSRQYVHLASSKQLATREASSDYMILRI